MMNISADTSVHVPIPSDVVNTTEVTTDQTQQTTGLDSLPQHVHESILKYLIDQRRPRHFKDYYQEDNLDISIYVPDDLDNVLNDHKPLRFMYKNGPWELKLMFDLMSINKLWRTRVQEWLYKFNKFGANEGDFHLFPAFFGEHNTQKIIHMEIYCKFPTLNVEHRPELLVELIEDFRGLRKLVLSETYDVDENVHEKDLSEELASPSSIIKFGADLTLRHPGLNRMILLPDEDTINDNERISRVLLDRGFIDTPGDALGLDWRAMEFSKPTVGPRQGVEILNSVIIRELASDKLPDVKIQDIAIRPGPGQSKDQILSSEIPLPGSSYTMMNADGFVSAVTTSTCGLE